MWVRVGVGVETREKKRGFKKFGDFIFPLKGDARFLKKI